MYKVYLAGPISEMDVNQSKDWRDQISELLNDNISGVSPLRHNEIFFQRLNSNDLSDVDTMKKMKSIVTRDRYDSTTSDMLIINLKNAKKVSIGTMIEIGWADANRIPIILISDNDNIHTHGMVDEIVGWKVETIEEAAKIANTVLC